MLLCLLDMGLCLLDVGLGIWFSFCEVLVVVWVLENTSKIWRSVILTFCGR